VTETKKMMVEKWRMPEAVRRSLAADEDAGAKAEHPLN
jgi:hypothetical protein